MIEIELNARKWTTYKQAQAYFYILKRQTHIRGVHLSQLECASQMQYKVFGWKSAQSVISDMLRKYMECRVLI